MIIKKKNGDEIEIVEETKPFPLVPTYTTIIYNPWNKNSQIYRGLTLEQLSEKVDQC